MRRLLALEGDHGDQKLQPRLLLFDLKRFFYWHSLNIGGFAAMQLADDLRSSAIVVCAHDAASAFGIDSLSP
jgi:hypothetical protein